MLRVHRPGYHSLVEIRSELAWLTAVHDENVLGTAVPLPGPDGSAVVAVPGERLPDGVARHVSRFAWLDGEEPSGERLVEDFGRLGGIAARLHAHARRWRAPAWFSRPHWDWAGALGPRGRWGHWQDAPGVGDAERRLLGRASCLLRDRLDAYGRAPARYGLIHADMRTANLLADPAAPVGAEVHVLDFDDCGFGWFLYDLAASLSFVEDDPRVPDLVHAWLTGYRRVGDLAAADEAEIGTMVLFRRLLLLAWVGSHQDSPYPASLGAGFARGTADLAERYLGGHALTR